MAKSDQRLSPTLRDVAKAASVSVATASKALNGQDRISPETRERVQQLARDLGYRPNNLAQSLHRTHSRTVGILTNDSIGRFTLPVVEAIEDRLSEQGFAVFLCNATDDPERERRHLDQLIGKRIDGLVVTSRRTGKRPSLRAFAPHLQIVYVYAQADDPDALSLLPDEEGGARLATEHLIGLGRNRIAHITGPTRFESVELRHKGYAEALKAVGQPVLEELFRTGNWSEATGHQAVAELFDGPGLPPDAIFCGNDLIGRAAIDALRERGIRVPQEVAVVGFDNWDVMVNGARPPLTSIDMNQEALGYEASRYLLEMIEGRPVSGIRRLPCTLVVRQSTVTSSS